MAQSRVLHKDSFSVEQVSTFPNVMMVVLRKYSLSFIIGLALGCKSGAQARLFPLQLRHLAFAASVADHLLSKRIVIIEALQK